MKVNVIYSKDGKELALQAKYRGNLYTTSPTPNKYVICEGLKERFARGIMNSINDK